MRRVLTASRTGLCVAAAVVLLAGCGGGSDDDTSASATTTSSSSAEASDTAGADPAFCDSARKLLGTLVPAVTGTDDPATLAPALAQAKADAEAVEPPAEIATDWAALRDGLDKFAQAAAAVVPNDTASAAQFLQTKTQLVAQLAGSAATVQTFLAQECGLTAAPTS